MSKTGKSHLWDGSGKLISEAQQLLAEGCAVMAADLFMQGEFLATKKFSRTRRVKNPREAAAYTFGYNDSVFARRVHDVLTLVAFVRGHEYTPDQVSLIGLGGAGHWVAAARAQARSAVDHAVIGLDGFRFSRVNELHHPDFLPGGAKYFDVVGMLAVAAPSSSWVSAARPQALAVASRCYRAAGKEQALQVTKTEANSTAAAIKWLLGR